MVFQQRRIDISFNIVNISRRRAFCVCSHSHPHKRGSFFVQAKWIFWKESAIHQTTPILPHIVTYITFYITLRSPMYPMLSRNQISYDVTFWCNVNFNKDVVIVSLYMMHECQIRTKFTMISYAQRSSWYCYSDTI